MKICTKCKFNKPLIEFHNDKSRTNGYFPQCKTCVQEYRIKNADKIKQYRIDNKDKRKQYILANIDKIRQQTKQYGKQFRIDNPDYIKQWNLDNPEHYKLYSKQYFQTEHGKLVKKSHNHKRRALLRDNTTGKHWTPQDIILKLKLQHGKCVYCETSIRNCYEIDHFKPISKGGSNESSNIQLLCKKCNGRGGKGTRDAIEYAKEHGKLI